MPYIPSAHKKYKLLPRCRKNGGEVFEYPSEMLEVVNKLLPNGESLIPYGYKSYDEYYNKLDGYMRNLEGGESQTIDLFCNRMVATNVKDTWAVLKYIGETTDDCEFVGLTHGKFYYCPRPKPVNGMIGVIDNEEFTSYMYPCDASDWIVYEDPTGEASIALNQTPKVDRMCPCCHKHYSLPEEDNLCLICGWERDAEQELNPDEEGGANRLSLNEAKKRFNLDGIELDNIFKLAFENLSTTQLSFICNEFNIDTDTLLSLSERELDCVYSVLGVYENTEYAHYGRRSDRYKMFVGIKTCIEEYFRKVLGNFWWEDDFSRQDVVMAHRFSNNHKAELEPEQKCGCFYCLSIFSSSEITEWLTAPNPCDKHGTAICPKCGIDSVIGESSGYPITPEFLKAMKDKWFS